MECQNLMQFLHSVKEAKFEIRRCEKRIEELRGMCTHVTQALTGMPSAHGGDSHHDAAIVALADKMEELTEATKAYSLQVHEVEQFIGRLHKVEHRMVMNLRYVDCMRWEKVQTTLYDAGVPYERTQIFNYHRDALRILHRLWEADHADSNSEV